MRYRLARLRETNVNDERDAVRMSERVVVVGGQPRLMSSEAEFRLALTMKHVAELQSDDGGVLAGAALDLDIFGRLTAHDLGLIERRVFLITLAAQVRYGLISQDEFDRMMAGTGPTASAAPQPVGQAAEPGAPATPSQSGPALLADLTPGRAGQPAAGHGC